jgi:hypothetical protein
MEMSILRQSEQSSNSSREVSQSIGRRLRGKPDHAVFYLSSKSTFRLSVEFSLDISASYPLSRAYTRLRLQRAPGAETCGGRPYFFLMVPGSAFLTTIVIMELVVRVFAKER